MTQGYIKAYRSLMENPVWRVKPLAKGQAWLELIMMANHEPADFLLGGTLEHVERGSFLTSQARLMERWGWSKTKLRGFFRLLEAQKMAVFETDRKRTRVTVLNYGRYQGDLPGGEGGDPAQGKQAEHLRENGGKTAGLTGGRTGGKTADEPPKDPNKKEKNDKTEKKEKERNTGIAQKIQKAALSAGSGAAFPFEALLPEGCPGALREAFAQYCRMRAQMRRPLTAETAGILLRRLLTLADDAGACAEILTESTLHGWLNVYPLRPPGQKACAPGAGRGVPRRGRESGNPFSQMLREQRGKA